MRLLRPTQIRENTVRILGQGSSGFTIGEVMSKAGMHAVKMEITTVGLQTVAPSIPRDPAEKDQLKEDLKCMGCEGMWLAHERGAGSRDFETGEQGLS